MKRSSLKRKLWIYLSIFSFIILVGIWFLQIVSLGSYYEFSKENEIKKVASKIASTYKSDNYSDVLDNLSFKKDVCIEIADNNNISYTTDSATRGCFVNNSRELNEYKLQFMNSNKKSITYKIINPRFDNKTLVYGIKLEDGVFAFISTSLEPIGSTISILKQQLILIMIIIFLIAFIIAYSISKKISKPIEEINKLSKNISKGDYNIKFNTKTDIEEINNLEETLNNAVEELSKTESLRRELLANVSHDLKTPLTLIKANAEMVKDLTYKNKEKRENNLSTIIDEVDRLNLLVEDILDLSKMQTNSITLDKEEFNLNDVIKSIINKFDILCEKDGYSIEYDGFDVNVLADKNKIERAIYNLINNAINYTGKNKKVFIKLESINDKVRIKICDTGKGISNEEKKYIWDKYYKLDKKYKRVTYGTGLGLSIVKNIFELHNLDYGVESEEDKGSIFYFDMEKVN